MKHEKLKQTRRQRRKIGIRKRIFGTSEKPRLTIYRSLNHIYAQVVDDHAGHTIASANTMQAKVQKGGNIAAASEIGKLIAERAKDAGVSVVMFDRNGFRYHGRVLALADAAREAGLQF